MRHIYKFYCNLCVATCWTKTIEPRIVTQLFIGFLEREKVKICVEI